MILEVKDIIAGYNSKQVLHEVSFSIHEPQVVAIIGHNGSGKSTLLKSIFGLLKVWGGTIRFVDKEIQNRETSANVREGISFVPQNQRVFPELSVLENLEIGGYILKDRKKIKQRLERVFELFPVLADKRNQRAGTLSGGEQQMVALGRGLMLLPKLLLLDEPSIGLSPLLVKKVLQDVRLMHERLGTTVLIVEQNVREVLNIADWVYILKNGEIVYAGLPDKFLKDTELLRSFFL